MKFWNFVKDKLEKGQRLMLMVVIDSKGSSPGRLGFKMVLSEDHQMEGSVGGGTMEFAIVELGKAMLELERPGPVLKKQIHKTDSGEDHSGMICSGEQTIALIAINEQHKNMVDEIVQKLDNEKTGVLELSADGMRFHSEESLSKAVKSRIKSESDWNYRQLVGYRNRICIIGSGHVGLALSKLMKDLDFVVEVFDDRRELNTFENNIYATKKHIINYNEIDKRIPQGAAVYVVIMTFAHKSDEKVLGKLIGKKFNYLGLMGSKTKIAKIYENLGCDPNSETTKNIFAPIGIPINSKTPMEIAVSIAAEIIKVKNE